MALGEAQDACGSACFFNQQHSKYTELRSRIAHGEPEMTPSLRFGVGQNDVEPKKGRTGDAIRLLEAEVIAELTEMFYKTALDDRTHRRRHSLPVLQKGHHGFLMQFEVV